MKKAVKLGTTVSLVLALLAAAFLLLSPCVVRGIRVTSRIPGGPSTEQGVCSSLIAASGAYVIGVVLLPAVLAAAALILSKARMPVGVWACAVLVLLFTIVTGFSIGLLFFPAALALLVAAVLQHVGESQIGGTQGE